MNIEKTKACIAVMQAYVDGKKIQIRDNPDKDWPTTSVSPCDCDGWLPTSSPSWDWLNWEYRIKPEPRIIYVNEEPTYRPLAYADPDIAEQAKTPDTIAVAVPYVRLSDVELLK